MVGLLSVLYLVRHGESVANVEGVFDGRDRKLTELGRAQAAAAARWLAPRPVAAMYASPYRRTRETAAIIAAHLPHNVETVVDTDLEEVKVGELAGRTDAAAREIYSRVYTGWLAGDRDARFPGGESLGEACDRLARLLDRIANRHRDREVVAVSHGGMPETALPLLLELPPGVRRQVDLAAITTLRLEASGRWVTGAESWGAVQHLSGLP